MDDKSVTPDPWAEIAAELRRIADDVENLIGHTPPGLFSIDVQPIALASYPPAPGQRDETIQAVDDAADVLLGKPAETKKLSDGKSVHHRALGRRGRIHLAVYQAVADAPKAERDEDDEEQYGDDCAADCTAHNAIEAGR